MSPPTIRQVDPINARTYDLEAPFAERRYEYLVGRRDQASDRLRTGSLALNGSSLVAMLAALGGDGSTANWIGLTQGNTAVAAAFFVVGAACSGASIILATGAFAGEAADAFERMLKARRVSASHEAFDSTQARAEAVGALTDMHTTPLVDFQFSRASIVTQSMGAGAWLGGMSVPLCTAFHVGDRAVAAWHSVAQFVTALI